jgi:hypothetical protein
MTRLLLADAAKSADARRPRSRQKQLGPSSVGVCRRKAGYEYHRHPQSDPENTVGMAAIVGTWYHKGALESMRTEWGAFIETTLSDGPLLGHADALLLPQSLLLELGLDIPAVVQVPTVDDLKTKMNGRMIDHVRSAGPKRSELFQTHLYADMFRRGRVRVDSRSRVSERMVAQLGPIDVQQVQLRFVTRDGSEDEYLHEQAYDPEITLEAWEWVGQITKSARPEDLPRDEDGPELSYVCDSCPFVTACWGIPAEGKRPQSVLIVEDADRTAALAEYHRGLELTREGDKLKALGKAIVEGSEPAIYHHGEQAYRLKWSGGKPIPGKPDAAAMAEILTDAGIDIPMLPATKASKAIGVVPYEVPEVLCEQNILPDLRSPEDLVKAYNRDVKAWAKMEPHEQAGLPEPVLEEHDPETFIGICRLKAKHTGDHSPLHATSDPLD